MQKWENSQLEVIQVQLIQRKMPEFSIIINLYGNNSNKSLSEKAFDRWRRITSNIKQNTSQRIESMSRGLHVDTNRSITAVTISIQLVDTLANFVTALGNSNESASIISCQPKELYLKTSQDIYTVPNIRNKNYVTPDPAKENPKIYIYLKEFQMHCS